MRKVHTAIIFLVLFFALGFVSLDSRANVSLGGASEAMPGLCDARTDPISVYAEDYEPYRRAYDLTKKTDSILSLRRTINVMLPWGGHDKFWESRYGLFWDNAPEVYKSNKRPALALKASNWTYHYPPQPHIGRWYDKRLQDSFMLEEGWGHDKEYGETIRMDYFAPSFPKAFAKEAMGIKNKGFHGVFLDWWHDLQPLEDRSVIAAARKDIAKAIRDELGEDFIILGNTNWHDDVSTHDYINGVFMEMYRDGREDQPYNCDEISRMESLLKLHEEKLQYPRIIAFEPGRVTTENSDEDRVTAENKTYMEMFTAMLSVLTEHGYILYADNNRDIEGTDHTHFYYDLYNLDLGQPISKGVHVLDGVGYKKYEYGMIAYNSRAHPVVLVFSSGRRVSLQPMSGVFISSS